MNAKAQKIATVLQNSGRLWQEQKDGIMQALETGRGSSKGYNRYGYHYFWNGKELTCKQLIANNMIVETTIKVQKSKPLGERLTQSKARPVTRITYDYK